MPIDTRIIRAPGASLVPSTGGLAQLIGNALINKSNQDREDQRFQELKELKED